MHAFNHIKDEPKKRKFCYFLRPAGHAPISIPVLKGLKCPRVFGETWKHCFQTKKKIVFGKYSRETVVKKLSSE